MHTLQPKLRQLREFVRPLNRLVVAFSGGVDSALVLKVAHQELGDGALAVTSDAAAVPRAELAAAAAMAGELGARHEIVKTRELLNENYAANPATRCYFCKSTLYAELGEIAKRDGMLHIANGTNVDDLGDYRPGLQAAEEFQIVSPLKEAGLTKTEVRVLAHELGLRVWDKPASPCLASRIPYGSRVTAKKLLMVERAEMALKELGIRENRVRHFNQTARIEVGPRHLDLVRENWETLTRQFNEIGFSNMELTEFRSGSLNDRLPTSTLSSN